MKAHIGIAIGAIAFASLVAASGCATTGSQNTAASGDRAAQDLYENECPECWGPGTAPITVEEAQ